jgi:biopolymer transport protein ExbB
MPVIAIGGIVALAVFLQRLFHLHRAQIRAGDFLQGIFNVLQSGNRVEAVSLCEETPGPVARIVRAALLCRRPDAEALRTAMEQTGHLEIRRLEAGIGVLATLAQIAPLLGLLGTVLGLAEALFQLRAAAPLVHAGDLADGLRQALLSTAAGLGLAIAAYTFHNALVGRVARIVHDMEMAALEILARFPSTDEAAST